jgi:serine phosphatase RsbU (regulator of sigma subunit)
MFAFVYLLKEAHASEGNSVTTEYVFADSAIELPSEVPQEGWLSFDSVRSNLTPQKSKSLWIKFRISDLKTRQDRSLGFEKVYTRFKFFKNDELIESFGTAGGYAGLPPQLIQLPSAEKNTLFFMKTDSDHTRIGPVGMIRLGQRSEFILDYFQKDAIKLAVISCLGLLSLAGFILFALYRNVTTYLYLALFSLCGLLYLMAGLQSRLIIGLNPVALGHAGYLALYCAPYFFIEFYRRIFSLSSIPLYLSVLRRISLAFPFLALMSAFYLPLGLLSALTFYYLTAVPLFLGILYHSATSLRKHPYSPTFFAGFILLLLAGVWEAANEVRIINSNIKVLPAGLLGFYLTLTTMQGQFFAQLFRTAKQNAEREAIAKQRLQRVLECTNILAQSRDYRSLFESVAKNISSELQITKEIFSIDFIFSDIKASVNDNSNDTLHHFTYQVISPEEPGILNEVIQDGNRRTSENQRDKLTSLPGIYSAGLHDSLGGPSSTLTVPIDFGVFYGAVVVRKYGVSEVSEFSIAEREEFISFINSIAAALIISLKNIDYVIDVKKKAIMDSQLDAARAQQFALLPNAPEIENISFRSFNRSAGKTGGDWHDCFFDDHNQRLFVTIGDVTGHDFASSIITGVAAGAVRAWKEHSRNSTYPAPQALEEIARLTNRVLCSSSQGLKFMTMIFMCLELETGMLHVVNAGHPHPFHLSGANKPLSLAISGHILGQSVEHGFKSESVQLQSNDQIFLYTDGLFDNESLRGEKLKRRTFLNFWSEVGDFESRFDDFVTEINNIWKDTELEDDVTCVLLGWRKPNENQNTAA